MEVKLCEDCREPVWPTAEGSYGHARRTRCGCCKALLCVECLHEHQLGNESVPGGCSVRMDTIRAAREKGESNAKTELCSR